MNRPFVNLNSKNIINDLLVSLDDCINHIKTLDGVIGITLNGGLSRGYADHLSEIDITIYLDKKNYEAWHKSKAPIPIGITKLNGYLYDIKIADFEDEEKRSWDSVGLWDLSYSKILFDPKAKILRLMEDKLSDTPKASEAEGLLFNSWWHYRLAGDIWIHRGDALQGHFILNKAISPLIEALFIANNEYIPHEKWIIHMSRSLNWKPDLWEQRLSQAMNTGDLSIQSLIERQTIIEDLWREIDEFFVNKECPSFKLKFSQRSSYALLKHLVTKGTVTIEEWETMSSITALNYDPFYSIVTVNNGEVILDRDKLLSLKPEDMYYWMYDVVNLVVKEM